jgi:hypothetical protein
MHTNFFPFPPPFSQLFSKRPTFLSLKLMEFTKKCAKQQRARRRKATKKKLKSSAGVEEARFYYNDVSPVFILLPGTRDAPVPKE